MNKVTLICIVSQLVLFNFITLSKEIENNEEIKKTLRFSDPKAEKQLVVDNVFGSITVVGIKGDEVKLNVHKTTTAKSEKKFARAQQEIRLEITEEDNLIDLYIDGPFRCKNGSVNFRGWRHYGYEVSYDFELQVPFETEITLKTVNDGEISVKKIKGNYTVDNVNGGIKMHELEGSGHVYAVNGDVTVEFNKNPEKNCYFGSLNGEVKIYFQSPLSADFRLKTFNGDVYSDFPVTHLPQKKPFKLEKRNGKKVYKCDKTYGVRAGDGGPEIELDGFNGDIHIYKQ